MKTLAAFACAAALVVSAAACGGSDSGVTTNIEAKFAQDELVRGHDIDVTSRDGVVTLTGELHSAEARERAVRLARETEGVNQVVDNLRVDAAATTGDRDELDVDIDVDRSVEGAVKDTGEALRDTGRAVRDAVTDDDRDSDNDGR